MAKEFFQPLKKKLEVFFNLRRTDDKLSLKHVKDIKFVDEQQTPQKLQAEAGKRGVELPEEHTIKSYRRGYSGGGSGKIG